MARPSRYPLELRRRAVRMVAEVRDDYPNETTALQAVADKLGIGSRETLRNWLKQHEIDAGTRPGTTTEESARIKALRRRTPSSGGPTRSSRWRRVPSRPSSTGHTRARSVHRRAPGPLRRSRADLQDARSDTPGRAGTPSPRCRRTGHRRLCCAIRSGGESVAEPFEKACWRRTFGRPR